MNNANPLQPLEVGKPITTGDIVRILWRRLWIVLLIMVVSLAAAAYVSKHTPKRWQADAALILVQRATIMSPTVDASYAAPLIETVETQVNMLQSMTMSQRTVDMLKNKALARGQSGDTVGITPEELQKSITVNNPKDTNILQVSVEAGSRDQATTLANAICKAFIQWKKEVARQNVEDTTNSLEARTQVAKAQMEKAEQRETQFKLSHQLVDVPTQQKAALENYLAAQADVANQQQELVSQEARMKALGDRLQAIDKAIKNGTGVRDDALVLSLQNQLNSLEMERASMALKYTPAYPGGLPDMDAKIADVKQRLAKAVKGTLDNTKPSLQAQGALADSYKQTQTDVLYRQTKLDEAIKLRDTLQDQLAGLPKEGRDYAGLVRDAEMATALYTSLQTALNATRLDRDKADGNVQMAQYAFAPEQPFRPNHTRDLLLGGAIGIFLSILSVLLMEQSDRRVRDVDNARKVITGPIIGAMPELSRAEMREMMEGRTPPMAIEAYSLARANLALAVRRANLAEPWDHQILMVTSAVPGEGKSLTAAELARSMARSGKNVILVDADMRRPSQNRLFRTAEPHGLADVLSGEMTLEEALVAGDVENLAILHSGTPRRNPTELISMPQMRKTLDALREEADVVILDTPAAATVADALLLAPYADCVLHVVGAGRVDEEVVQETTQALHAAAPKTMVFFLNRASRNRGQYSKYYYRERSYLEETPVALPARNSSDSGDRP